MLPRGQEPASLLVVFALFADLADVTILARAHPACPLTTRRVSLAGSMGTRASGPCDRRRADRDARM